MKVTNAKLSDISRLEEIARDCYKKMEFKGEYDSEFFKLSLQKQMENDNYIILKCTENNLIIGGLFALVMPEVYSPNTSVIYQYAMQADVKLNKVKQGRVILKLIRELEKIAVDIDVHEICFNIDCKFDLSQHFSRHGYKLTEKKLTRRLK